MANKQRISHRIISMILIIGMLMSYIPLTVATVFSTASPVLRVSDTPTLDNWKNFFGNTHLSTENAGRVWTDKSVMTSASQLGVSGVTLNDTETGFLVALSAIGSNATVTGEANLPADVVFVLDLSNSMDSTDRTNLVNATNESIGTLMADNPNTRISVICFSGSSSSNTNNSAAVVTLPLNTYTTGFDGRYVQVKSGSQSSANYSGIGVDSDVRIKATNTAPSTPTTLVGGATYTQKGIILAMQEFLNQSETTYTNEYGEKIKRQPVLVLMSDGLPSLATTSYTAPGQYNQGDGSGGNARTGFLTQLSAAYAKKQITSKYGTNCLFYTLGLGLGSSEIAIGVLNPSQNTNDMNNMWTNFTAGNAGSSVTVYQQGNTALRVVKESDLSKDYVNQYFSASNSSGLSGAFESIVTQIELQTRYHPTHVDTSLGEDFSGYVSFVDNIGEYMNVTDVKGLIFNGTLHTGEKFAQSIHLFGSEESATTLGDEFVRSVRARLGITQAQAWDLIRNAYANGQIAYSTESFSNKLSWYADANGAYVAPYPSADGTHPATATYIMTSYGFMGETDSSTGVLASDMMYTTVRVRRNIATGDEMVAFAIPAALLPVVAYNVTLDAAGNPTDMKVTGADSPLRLVYEVALRDDINEFTLNKIVDSVYRTNNTEGGNVVFYANRFDPTYDINTIGQSGSLTTYSYFNPSTANGNYYYADNATIYVASGSTYVPYTGTAAPASDGTYYFLDTYYTSTGSTHGIGESYVSLDSEALDYAVQDSVGGEWYIPKGTPYVHIHSSYTEKADPTITNTVDRSNDPYIHTLGAGATAFYAGAVLGNNGKLAIKPGTGFEIIKNFEGAGSDDTAFTFDITSTPSVSDGSYRAQFTAIDGTVSETTVAFADGKASVSLKVGERIAVIGFDSGVSFDINEEKSNSFKLVKINGAAAASTSATVTTTDGVITETVFTNAKRGVGGLAVTKLINADKLTGTFTYTDHPFKIRIELFDVNGAPVSGTFNASVTDMSTGNPVSATATFTNGVFETTLVHGQAIDIEGITEDYLAKVSEILDPADALEKTFTSSYWVSGINQASSSANVYIAENSKADIDIVNEYNPESVSASGIKIFVDKTFKNRVSESEETFTFKLQKYIPATSTTPENWEDIASVSTAFLKNDGLTSIEKEFANALASTTFTATGSYNFRVIEEITNAKSYIAYDSNRHSFTVTVTDKDMDGKLEVSSVTSMVPENVTVSATSGGYTVTNYFVNTYIPGSITTTQATVDITKTALNNSGLPTLDLSGFVFILTDSTGTVIATSDPTNERGFVRLNIGGLGAGTYSCTLKEVDGGLKGWSYDTTAIDLTVKIIDNGDGTYTTKIFEGQTEPAGATNSVALGFNNTYTPESVFVPLDFFKKQLSGRTMTDTDIFDFVIRYVTDSTDPLSIVTEEILVGTNNKDGKITLVPKDMGKLTFNGITLEEQGGVWGVRFEKTGRYYFSAFEKPTTIPYIAIDGTLYKFEVVVSDALQSGTLAAEVLITTSVSGNEIVFKNSFNEPPKGSIAVSKFIDASAITGAFTYPIHPFNITLTMLDEFGNPASGTFTAQKSGEGTTTIAFDSAGVANITLKHNQTIRIDGITVGSKITVKENLDTADPFEKHFTTEYRVAGIPAAAPTVTIANNTVADVDVFNKYRPESVTGNGISVSVEKQFANKVATSNETFTFVLEALTPGTTDTWTELAKTDITFAPGETNDTLTKLFADVFDSIVYTKTGSYVYRIIEIVSAPKSYIEYNTLRHSFTVHVTDTLLDGKLEISDVTSIVSRQVEITKNAGEYSVLGKFVNTYVPGSPNANGFYLDITKSAKNNSGLASLDLGGFKFILKDSTNAVVATSASTNTRGFVRLSVSGLKAGDYTYTLEEINDGRPGWTYDPKVITLKVRVTDNGDGTYTSKIYINDADIATANNTLAVGFENTYTPSPANVGLDFFTKELTGRPMTDSDVFNFVVKLITDASDPANYVMTDILVGVNDKTGKITFTPKDSGILEWNGVELVQNASGEWELSFTKAGRYFFNALETSADADGIISDRILHKFEVNIVDPNEDGSLEASLLITTGSSATHITFKNTYKPAATQFTVEGIKTLSGRIMTLADGFAFKLTPVKINDVAVTSPVIMSASLAYTDGKIGNFAFPQLTFDAVGTYEYTISEVQGTLGGITYDTEVYTLILIVTDDGKGKLSVTSAKLKAESAVADADYAKSDLLFNNIYTAEEADAVEIPIGEKVFTVIHGDISNALVGGEFTFNLYRTNSTWTYSENDKIASVTNGAGSTGKANFKFPAQTFKTAGAYYYIVKEANAGLTLNGVTHDAREYRVVITVKDDGLGNLVAGTPEISLESGAVSAITFENTYSAGESAEIIISGKKTLNGRELQSKEFTFLLSESDSNGNAYVGGIATFSTQNEADGSFSFEGLTFNASGTYYFVITEDSSAGATGITYDDSRYLVKIVIEDNGIGQYTLASPVEIFEIVGDANVSKEKIEFVNEYETEPPVTEPPVTEPPVTTEPVTPPETGDASTFRFVLILACAAGFIFTVIPVKRRKEEAEG